MTRLLKPALLALAVCVSLWLVVFACWQFAARLPSTADIVLWLLLPPVGAVLVGAIFHGTRRAPERVSNAGAVPGRQAADAAVVAADATRFRATVLCSAMRTPGGASAQALAAAILDGQGAAPDLELKNDAGFPVFASRIAKIDTDEMQALLAALPICQSGDVDAATLSADRLRAMHILSETLAELLSAAEAFLEMLPTDHDAAEPPRLHLSLLLPGGWREAERALARQWVQHECRAQSPQHAWAIDDNDREPGVTGLAMLDHAIVALHRETKPSLWMVLASESAISDGSVGRWEAEGVLFASDRRSGRMPGEAAAGLLLARPGAVPGAERDRPQLSRPAIGRLASSADTARVGRATLLGDLVDAVLATARLESEGIDAVVSDADARVTRVTEIAHLLQERLPHVPFDGNNFMAGVTCAHMGVAGDGVALALACHLAADHGRHLLVASVADPFARGAVLVLAPSPEKDGGAT